MKKKIQHHIKSNRFARITCSSPRKRLAIERGYFLQVSEKLALLYECDDFRLRSYIVIPIQQIKKIRFNKSDAFYAKIATAEGIKTGLKIKTEVDLSDWTTLFSHFKDSEEVVIIECEDDEVNHFLIGKITKIKSKSVWIHHFNARGKLDKKATKVKFKNITKITFDDRYIDVFAKYVYK